MGSCSMSIFRVFIGSVRATPDKFNDDRSHTIQKAKVRVTNWPDYDAALVRRESLVLRMTQTAISAWHTPSTRRRGDKTAYAKLGKFATESRRDVDTAMGRYRTNIDRRLHARNLSTQKTEVKSAVTSSIK